MNLSKKIEAGANLATIVLVVLFGWTMLHGGFVRSSVQPPSREPAAPKVGMNLNQTPLRDVNWAAAKNTLVLGMQTGCHYCTESGPFFQKLASAASGNSRIVAVLPQSVEESKQYLAKLAVHVDEIRNAPLSSVGVGGTPTLMLVDNKGVVRKVWVGKLPDEQQAEVLSAIVPKVVIHLSGL